MTTEPQHEMTHEEYVTAKLTPDPGSAIGSTADFGAAGDDPYVGTIDVGPVVVGEPEVRGDSSER